MKNQSWMMLICCLAPLLLFVVGPALGLNKGNAVFVLIPVMILVCFMMMGKGGGCCGNHRHQKKENESDDKQKDGKQGCH